jgi:hypothetical protein
MIPSPTVTPSRRGTLAGTSASESTRSGSSPGLIGIHSPGPSPVAEASSRDSSRPRATPGRTSLSAAIIEIKSDFEGHHHHCHWQASSIVDNQLDVIVVLDNRTVLR